MNEQFDWWWLSFADEEKGFLGVVIVFAADIIHACEVAHALKINPGGHAKGKPLSTAEKQIVRLFDSMRLLGKEEAKSLVGLMDDN